MVSLILSNAHQCGWLQILSTYLKVKLLYSQHAPLHVARLNSISWSNTCIHFNYQVGGEVEEQDLLAALIPC